MKLKQKLITVCALTALCSCGSPTSRSRTAPTVASGTTAQSSANQNSADTTGTLPTTTGSLPTTTGSLPTTTGSLPATTGTAAGAPTTPPENSSTGAVPASSATPIAQPPLTSTPAASQPPGGDLSWAGSEEPGKATWYAATGDGNCSLGTSPQDMMVAAMNQDEWKNSQSCGTCVLVKGPNGIQKVRIVDRCPECHTGHLDLSHEAFGKVATFGTDVPAVSWLRVPCGYTTPMEYKVKKGSNPWWLALQIRNHNVPVQAVWLKTKDKWLALTRQSDNYFLAGQEVDHTGPYQIRIQAVDGRQVEDTFAAIEPEKVFPGTAQFP